MPTSAAMKQVLQSYLDRFNARDIEGIVALYAADASIEDPVGKPPLRGHDAIREFYKWAIQSNSILHLARPIRGTQGNCAAMAFDIRIPLPEGEQVIQVIDVMSFNEAGLVTSMRAFWDPDDMG